MSLYIKGKRLRGIPCYRPILRDPSISDGEFRTLMLLKAKSKHGMVTVKRETLAKERCVTIRTIGRHLQNLEDRRLIRIVHNIERGQWVESTYSIDDEFYAKYLRKKPAPPKDKNVPAVSYDTISTPSGGFVSEDPPNVIRIPSAKPKRSAG